jgi:D-alanyl-D-alanine endopeptidase (penicillin-binding protein 7)
MLKKSFAALLLVSATSAFALPFSSQSALVIEESSGKILLEKNADKVVSIASLTKLMTAMVVLDAKQDMEETIVIEQSDVDMLKHSSSRLPVGVALPRKAILHLALMSSENRAAASLARTYPGGNAAFLAAMQAKLKALGMSQTVIEEPTGLSPHNISNAGDLIKMAIAAGDYAEIAQATTDTRDLFSINGRATEYRNTNHFVGQKGWDILLSKTGYTMEAGRCLVMRMKSAGKNVVLVLLNAKASQGRSYDAVQIQRFLTGVTAPLPKASARQVVSRPVKRSPRQRARTMQVAKL